MLKINKKAGLGILIFIVLGLSLAIVIRNKNLASPGSTKILSGKTMGTIYSISIIDSDSKLSQDNLSRIQESIDKLLVEVNALMSIYQDDSNIMDFNRYKRVDWYEIPESLYQMIKEALNISEHTGGYYDITVGELVKLWKFGPGTRSFSDPGSIPRDEEIKKVLEYTGYKKVELKEENSKFYIKKLHPKMFLDLSSIAKGYGVDRIAQFLEQEGFKNYLVEIGGDLVTSGVNGNGKKFRVGVQQPSNDDQFPMRVLEFSGKAIATSGSYKNFYTVGRVQYSHLIDPHTGRSQSSAVLSTSVIAQNCQTADAWATALYLMSYKEGLELASNLGLGVYYIYVDDKGSLAEAWNDEFSKYLEKRK